MRLKKLSKMLDLELAWRRVQKDQYNDFIPDMLLYDDFKRDAVASLNGIKKSLDGDYEPSDLLEIDVPKKGYTLRPGSNQKIEDRIVYQALIDFISARVDESPPDCVYSFRLNKKPRSPFMFERWKPLWLRWRREMRKCFENGFRCLLKTDIAAFFEHIDYVILRNNTLEPHIKDKRILNLLNKLLRKWALSEAKHLGIPQGCDSSSFLSKIYLTNVDKIMQREGYRYFRYSDEIFIFTHTKNEARKALKSLIHELRKMHLNIQEKKTEILTDFECIKQEIGTKEEDRTREFDYGFVKRVGGEYPNETEEEVLKRYKEVTKRGKAREVDKSGFVWCLNRLKKLRSDKAVNFVIRRLGDLSFITDTVVRYLVPFVNRKKVKDAVCNFLSSENNIYEWQEMWLLILLSHSRNLDKRHLDVIRSIITDQTKHRASRAAAMITLGKLGDHVDRNYLKGLFKKEDNPYLKRAILIACHSMPKQGRNKFYGSVKSDSVDIKRLVSYLRQDIIKTIEL